MVEVLFEFLLDSDTPTLKIEINSVRKSMEIKDVCRALLLIAVSIEFGNRSRDIRDLLKLG